MKDIYKSAQRALVWLGEDDDTFSLACDLMRGLVSQMIDQMGGWESVKEGSAKLGLIKDFEWDSKRDLLEVRTHGIPSYDSPAWDALQRLFNRPCFTRMRVIQEIILSQRAIACCGNQELDWEVIELAALLITNQRYDARSQRPGLSQAKNISMVWNFAKKSTLGSLLLLTRDFQATEPKDKVFGLLGLATDCCNPILLALQPNYTKPTSYVYSNATRYLIHQSQSLDVLSHIGYVAPFEDPNVISRGLFPSWVPRWDKGKPRTQGYHNTSMWGRAKEHFSAAGNSTVAAEVTHQNPDSITLYGMRIDKVKTVSPIILGQDIATTDIIYTTWNRQANKLKKYPTGDKRLRAFSLTIVADTTLNKVPAFLDPQQDLDFASYISAHGGNLDGLSKEEENLLHDNSVKGDEMRYGIGATNAMEGRSFCTTELEWMGICSPMARVGDLICLLFGGKVLYTVRRESKSFTFLGECYIHGRMDGSALED